MSIINVFEFILNQIIVDKILNYLMCLYCFTYIMLLINCMLIIFGNSKIYSKFFEN